MDSYSSNYHYTSNYYDDSWLEANVWEIVYTEEFQRIIGNKLKKKMKKKKKKNM